MIKFRIAIILLLGLTCVPVTGQIRERRTPVKAENTTERLALQITRGLTSDADKARAIFIWIAENITYDSQLRVDKKLQRRIYTSEDNVISNVLKRKKALCGGYAFLYTELCKKVGIPSRVIHGYNTVYNKDVSNRKVDHSWNAVKLNGKWELLDISWAMSMRRGEDINFYWYLTDPKTFAYSHHPEDPKWNLFSQNGKIDNYSKF